MSSNEFDLIERYFKNLTHKDKDVICDIGDDAAILSLDAGCELAISTDTLVDDVHFPHDTDAFSVGYKSLAVNLSDMAAMGAKPRWASLSLTLPGQDEDWLSAFSRGFAELARQYEVALIGGDMSRGPLSITVQIMGTVQKGRALTRAGAQIGDSIFVSGKLGCAAFALSALQRRHQLPESDDCLLRLNRPQPRIEVGQLLSEFASAAIDISDGLVGDLGHILQASSVSAEIELEKVPVCEKLSELGNCDERWKLALASGDDYELCFTVPDSSLKRLEELENTTACLITRIGRIVDNSAPSRWLLDDGSEYRMPFKAYRHFSQD